MSSIGSEFSKNDIKKLYNFLMFYEKTAKNNYGKHDWTKIVSHPFIIENDIQMKCISQNHKPNYFRFETHSVNGVNDTTFYLIRHIRNAIAHGNITKKGGKMVELYDKYKKKDGSIKFTMKAIVRADLFWEIIKILCESNEN